MNSQWTGRVIVRLMLERKLLVAGITLPLLLIAVVLTFLLPRQYECETRVRVLDSRALRAQYGLQPSATEEAVDLEELITSGFLSREATEHVVGSLGLDAGREGQTELEASRDREKLIRTIQGSIQVELLENGPEEAVFRLSCKYRDPAIAQRIVTGLAGSTQAWLLSHDPAAAAAEAAKIQLARAMTAEIKVKLETANGELENFKAENPDIAAEVPDRFEDACRLARESLRTVDREIASLTPRLNDLRAQLAEEPEWLSGPGSERTLNATHAELARSVERANSELAELDKQRADRAEQLESLETEQAAVPALREQWEALCARRDGLMKALSQAEEAERVVLNEMLVGRADQCVILDVMDPPRYPAEPDVPNRMIIAFLGLVIGLGVGTGTVLTLDLLDQSLRNAPEVERLLDLPVLGMISPIVTPAEHKRARRRSRAATVGIVALFFLTAAALFVQLSSDGDVGALMARVLEVFK